MTVTSPAPSVAEAETQKPEPESETEAEAEARIKAETLKRRTDLLKVDLARAFKECGPRLFTPNPTYGTRIFVIADEEVILDPGMCTKLGVIHRSALVETITEAELDEIIDELRTDGYDVKKESVVADTRTGSYVSYRSTYYAGNSK